MMMMNHSHSHSHPLPPPPVFLGRDYFGAREKEEEEEEEYRVVGTCPLPPPLHCSIRGCFCFIPPLLRLGSSARADVVVIFRFFRFFPLGTEQHTHSFIQPPTHSFTHSFTHLARSPIHPNTHLAHSPCPLTQTLTLPSHPLIHPLTHPFTHPFTLPFTHSPRPQKTEIKTKISKRCTLLLPLSL